MSTQRQPLHLLALAALALAGCGGTSISDATPVPIVITVVVTAAPDATFAPTAAPAETTEAAPTPTLDPLVSKTVPTGLPASPTPTLGPPTPTLEPLVSNTIPGDGNQFDQLPFNTTANDPGVGPNNGDGIASVTFQFYGPDNKLAYEHTEKTPQYCAFGGGDNGQDCNQWIFSEHHNQWPDGSPATPGGYRLVATVRGTRGGTTVDERNITLDLDNTATAIEATIIPADTAYGDELAFQVNANDTHIGANNGDGIANVTFQIYAPGGDKVYERTERNALYCAFGGGDNGQPCTTWRFSEHGYQWPGGAALENGATYKLVATINTTDGPSTTRELEFTISV